MFGTVRAITFVGVYDRFGIAVGIESVTELLKFFSKLAVVIDFPVEDNPGSAIPIMDWLLTAFQIDDRKPAHPQSHATVHIEAIIIRTSMPDCVAHPTQKGRIYV